MRFSKAWIVAAKDLKIFGRKKNVLRSVVLFPLLVSIGLPLVVRLVSARHGRFPSGSLHDLLGAFSFFFVIVAAYLPTAIAAYSLIGEKVEKSLEPLLATPTTDSEILLGKSIAGFVPPILAIYAGAVVFMVLMDSFTHNTLNYLYFPNWSMAIILLLVVPLAAILSIEMSVIVSARVNDARSAQLFGSLAVFPFAAIYVVSELGLLKLNIGSLFIISAVILVVDVVLFFISTKTFQREEILTKWT